MGFLLSGPGLAGIAIAICLAFGGLQTYRLHSCQAEFAATKAQVTVLGAHIGEQNRAVEALQAAGAAKAKESAQALIKAEGKAKVWEDNAVRLQSVLTNRKPTDPRDCAAAWKEIRK